MTRQNATKLLRDELDKSGLPDWKIRLNMDIRTVYLGLCDYKTKTIVLNAFHVDTHPDIEIINTVRHEVAHALTPTHNHDEVWVAKAKELGCDNTLPCATYGLDARAINAIRSNDEIEITYDEHVVRTPSYKIHKFQEKCPTCNKIAVEDSSKEVKTSKGRVKIIKLKCGHIIIKDADSTSDFDSIVFDTVADCNHVWDKSICMKCNAKRLFPFQIDGARAIEAANGRFAILDEMGLGKTIQALAYLKFHKQDAHPFLWVTKAGTLYQHAAEITRILGNEAFPQIIRKGTDKIWSTKMNLAASYDIFRRLDLNMFKHIKCIILDEVQAIKNPDSTRTQCIRRIAKDIDKKIPLSGTFWKNRGSEAFVMLNMLDPIKFDSFERFKRSWVATYYDGNKEKEGGIKHPKEFREQIKHIAIRRERTEVLPELPLVNRTRLLCEMPPEVKDVYQKEEDTLVKLYNDAVIGGTEDSFANQSSMLAQLNTMRQIVGLAKVNPTVEYAKEFLEETDRKLAIFVHHKKCGEMIKNQMIEYCKENNLQEPLILTADLNAEERFSVQSKFNSDKHRLLVASTLASGEGLNLQSCADCVMMERQWNPANEEQAEGRFIRIGQTATSVNAVYVHGDETIDTKLDAIVNRKRIQFHESMNTGEIPTWSESDVIKELVESIVRDRRKKK